MIKVFENLAFNYVFERTFGFRWWEHTTYPWERIAARSNPLERKKHTKKIQTARDNQYEALTNEKEIIIEISFKKDQTQI